MGSHLSKGEYQVISKSGYLKKIHGATRVFFKNPYKSPKDKADYRYETLKENPKHPNSGIEGFVGETLIGGGITGITYKNSKYDNHKFKCIESSQRENGLIFDDLDLLIKACKKRAESTKNLNEEGFENFLKLNTELSEKSIKNYCGGIRKISNDLREMELLDKDLFSISEINELHKIEKIYFENPEKAAFDEKNKRMYSSALKRLIEWRIIQNSMPLSVDLNRLERIPADRLAKVTPKHIFNAIQQIIEKDMQTIFGESTDYDLVLENDIRLAPKAVFGIAATEALGFPVLPKRFGGGKDSACFRILKKAGYTISKKDGSVDQSDSAEMEPDVAINPDDFSFTAGSKTQVNHLRSERARGLAEAKRTHFREKYGKLFCERCSMDPVKFYGSIFGESCIEVHHVIPLSESKGQRITNLDDLQCLCASCHRVGHREMREMKKVSENK